MKIKSEIRPGTFLRPTGHSGITRTVQVVVERVNRPVASFVALRAGFGLARRASALCTRLVRDMRQAARPARCDLMARVF